MALLYLCAPIQIARQARNSWARATAVSRRCAAGRALLCHQAEALGISFVRASIPEKSERRSLNRGRFKLW
jgi:hypothetical protein